MLELRVYYGIHCDLAISCRLLITCEIEESALPATYHLDSSLINNYCHIPYVTKGRGNTLMSFYQFDLSWASGVSTIVHITSWRDISLQSVTFCELIKLHHAQCVTLLI